MTPLIFSLGVFRMLHPRPKSSVRHWNKAINQIANSSCYNGFLLFRLLLTSAYVRAFTECPVPWYRFDRMPCRM